MASQVFTTNHQVAIKLTDDITSALKVRENRGFAVAEQKQAALKTCEVVFPNFDMNKWGHPKETLFLLPGDKVALRSDFLTSIATQVQEVDGVKFLLVDDSQIKYVVRDLVDVVPSAPTDLRS